MCALQFATESLNLKGKEFIEDNQISDKINAIDKLLSDHLKETA